MNNKKFGEMTALLSQIAYLREQYGSIEVSELKYNGQMHLTIKLGGESISCEFNPNDEEEDDDE